MGIDHGKVR